MKHIFRGISLATKSENIPEFMGRFRKRRSPRVRLHPAEQAIFKTSARGLPSNLKIFSVSYGGVGLVGLDHFSIQVGDTIDGHIHLKGHQWEVSLEVVYLKKGEIGCMFKKVDGMWIQSIKKDFPTELEAAQMLMVANEKAEGLDSYKFIGAEGGEIIIYEDAIGPVRASVLFHGMLFSLERSEPTRLHIVEPGRRLTDLAVGNQGREDIPNNSRKALEVLILNVPELSMVQRHFLYDQISLAKAS